MPQVFQRFQTIALALSVITACSPERATSPNPDTISQSGRQRAATLDTWETVAPIPMGRIGLSAAEAGGKIYAFGGAAFTNNCVRVSNADVYDPATNTWESRAPMLAPRYAAHIASVGNIIYLIGGENGCGVLPKTVLTYNTVTDTWSQGAPPPEPLYNGISAAAVVDGIIYVGGGTAQNRFYAYDPAADSWMQKTSMPSARGGHSIAAFGGKVYVIGGYGSDGSPGSVLQYDPNANTWATKAESPVYQDGTPAIAVGGRIHTFGGHGPNGMIARAHAAYNPVTDIWTIEPLLPTGQLGAGAAVVGGTVYAIGGWAPPDNVVSHVRAFTPTVTPPPNQSPVARAGPDQLIKLAGSRTTSVILDAGGSSDPDGDALTFTWTWSLGEASGVSPTVTLPVGTHTITLTVNDGNETARSTVTILVIDDTPPNIWPIITGTLGNNGWYTSDVTISWSVVDDESAITSSTNCVQSTVTADTENRTITCTAVSAGGTGSMTVQVKRDATAPVSSVNAVVDGEGSVIASGGATLSDKAVFTVGGSDAWGIDRLECILDAGDYTPCSTIRTYSGQSVGLHVFRVRAVDSAGNTSSPATFTWAVVTPAQAVQSLLASIADMNLPTSVSNSLNAPLRNLNTDSPGSACGKLNAFLNQVDAKVKNGQLTIAASTKLLSDANAIRRKLGCG